MSTPTFTLRELQPTDRAALTKLITEFDGDLTTRFQVDPYAAIISGTEHRTRGVGVESSDHEGLIGMGTVRFGEMKYNDALLPFAFLDGLKVHKEYRGNGLGTELARWRVQKAREAFGENGVIATGMLYDNYASHAVASKWAREFLESSADVLILPMRTSPPQPLSGVEVRELAPNEYEEFASKQNHYYRDFNFHTPASSASITNALAVSVEGKQPYRYYAAVDGRGNLLAGAQAWARGLLKADTVNNPPAPMRMMNRILHILPPDFTIRDVSVIGLWFEPGQFQAGQFLWEMMRWLCRDQGTTLVGTFDSRDDTMRVVNIKPWHQPRPTLTFAVHGPAPIDRKKLLFILGRV